MKTLTSHGSVFLYGRLLRCDHDVVVASQIVILIARVRPPLVTPKQFNAEVAQLVVQRSCKAKVEGSSPFFGTNF